MCRQSCYKHSNTVCFCLGSGPAKQTELSRTGFTGDYNRMSFQEPCSICSMSELQLLLPQDTARVNRHTFLACMFLLASRDPSARAAKDPVPSMS